jgi:hypothetical protein
MIVKKPNKYRKILLKALYVQLVFLVLHFAYDFCPHPITKIFSGVNEAVFQHMKIAFFSYGFVSLVEFLANRNKVADQTSYGFARLGAMFFYSWLIFILFFVPPAYYGQYQTVAAEIVSANIILYITSLCAIVLELQFESVTQTKEFRVMMTVLSVLLLSLFVIYTYQDPWFDVFAVPPGWG